MAKEPIIRISGLHYSYQVEGIPPIPALLGIDLEIRVGEYVAIIGPNGSGKSTLAKHLNALLLPAQGDVWVRGLNTKDVKALREIRKTVGMVFQLPDSQIVGTVVEEDVAFGPENLGIPQPELGERVERALAEVGLLNHRHRPPHLLSEGEKQRLAIAGVLAVDPEGLILDEATALLDPQSRDEVLELVRRLHRAGRTIISITHSMEEAAEAERVLVLYEGKVAMDGTPRQIFAERKRLQALQLDLPSLAELSHLLRNFRDNFPSPLLSVEEIVRELLRLRLEVV